MNSGQTIDTRKTSQFSKDAALFRAIKKRNIREMRRALLEEANPNAAKSSSYSGNFTALMCAAGLQFPEGVKFLLKAGADPNARQLDGRVAGEGMTTLYHALGGSDMLSDEQDLERRTQIVKTLIAAGADPSIPAGDRLPLWDAAAEGYFEIVKALISAGANPQNVPADCMPPLHGAALGGKVSIARYFLKRGAEVDAPTPDGTTPLMAAAYSGHLPLVRLFLEHGANPNARDNDGDTPLIRAAKFAQEAIDEQEHESGVQMAQHLVDAGADSSARNLKGRSPLDIAKDTQFSWLRQYLEKLGNADRSPKERRNAK